MPSDDDSRYLVAVVGAGPAGIYAADELAKSGARVLLLNRDIKPGGLGTHLMREVMDDVQFMPTPADGGNLLRMVKKLPKGPDNET